MRRGRVVILAAACPTTNLLYHYLSKRVEIDSVVIEDAVPRLELISRRIKKLGIAMVLGQLIFLIGVAPLLRFLSRKRLRRILERHQLDASPIPAGKIRRVKSVNDPGCAALLNSLQPACVLVNGTRIIAASTLRGVHAPFVNIHAGITPLFRGVHGGYWAMASGRKDLFGATIHFVDERIDTGEVIKQTTTAPEKGDNYATYAYLQYAAILEPLAQICARIQDGHPPGTVDPLVPESRFWSHPTLLQWVKNLRRTM